MLYRHSPFKIVVLKLIAKPHNSLKINVFEVVYLYNSSLLWYNIVENTQNLKKARSYKLMIKSNQLSLNDIYAGCLESFGNDKPKFLSMLEEHLDINALIPLSSRMHFRNHTGRPRQYSLSSFILALINQRIFRIHTDSLLIVWFNEILLALLLKSSTCMKKILCKYLLKITTWNCMCCWNSHF